MSTTANYQEEEKQALDGLADRLPELDDDALRYAASEKQMGWVFANTGHGLGYVWTLPEYGLSLQIVRDPDTMLMGMRLLTMIDHDWCLLTVANMKATLEAMGRKMDLSGAVIVPYVPGENVTAKQNHMNMNGKEDGMEVA